MKIILVSNPFRAVKYTGKENIEVLCITHKYRMDAIEEDVLSEMKKATDTAGLVDLVVASRVVDSPQLREETIQRLVSSKFMLSLEEAMSIGVEAYYTIVTTNNRQSYNGQPYNNRHYRNQFCGNCGYFMG